MQLQILKRGVVYVIFLFLLNSVAFADSEPTGQSPTMEETVDWLVPALLNVGGSTGWMQCIYRDKEHDNQCLYSGNKNQFYFRRAVNVDIRYEDVVIKDCLLKLKQVESDSADNGPMQIDQEKDLWFPFRGYDPSFNVVDKSDSAVGAKDIVYAVQFRLTSTGQYVDAVHVKNSEMAQRIGNAMSHLIVLCGWKAQPF